MCDEAWTLWMWHIAAKGTEEEQSTLNAYLAHRMAEDKDSPCRITKEQANAMRNAPKVTIAGTWR